MKPTYKAMRLPSGDTEVRVTAHPMWADMQQNGPVTVTLTPDQYQRFLQWFNGAGLIQDLLPDLDASTREKLQSGLDDESFGAIANEGDEK